MVSYVQSLHAETLHWRVLILIVVDNGIVHDYYESRAKLDSVLILIVVDNGIVPVKKVLSDKRFSLNPYCSGQWYRTFFILILAMLRLQS